MFIGTGMTLVLKNPRVDTRGLKYVLLHRSIGWLYDLDIVSGVRRHSTSTIDIEYHTTKAGILAEEETLVRTVST